MKKIPGRCRLQFKTWALMRDRYRRPVLYSVVDTSKVVGTAVDSSDVSTGYSTLGLGETRVLSRYADRR